MSNTRPQNGHSVVSGEVISHNLSMGNDVDALKVTIYPEIVASTPFIIDLFDTQVQTLKGNETMALTDYLKTTRQSLVSTIISLPFKVLGKIMSLFRSDEEGADIVTSVDPFHLTKPQAMAASALRRQIQTFVDKKTGITTINVTMQDPKVAAMVADVVITNLKEYITKYRISKAADDCKYWEEIYEKRKEEYYQAQKNFADYSDANRNVVLQSVLNERERLHNEKALALQLYTSVATQMQMARAKVQEAKPVFEVVEPATIPRKSSGTSRSMTIMVFIFLGAASASGWILFGRDLFKKLKNFCKSCIGFEV